MDKRRVPVLVYHDYDTKKRGYTSIELYGFDEDLLCPMFPVDCPPPPNLSDKDDLDDMVHVIDDSYRARPFTGLNSCPDGCAFASLGTHIYVTGGTELSSHHIDILDSSKDVSDVVKVSAENPRLDPDLSSDEATAFATRNSKRVKRFQIPKFINSLSGNNERGEIEFGDLDGDSKAYWETCPSMSEGRSQHDLLTLRGKLYAIGGDERDESTGKASFSIEVFEHDGWTPILIQPPPDIDPYGLISVAIEHSNAILVGSEDDDFYVIHVSDGKGVATSEKIRLMCSDHLFSSCFQTPIVVDIHCLLWYDVSEACIRGFHLSTNGYFEVDMRKNLVVPKNKYNIQSAKLTNLGDGILCLIYTVPDLYVSFDDHGVEHVLRDYRKVTFKIDFRDFLENGCDKPFPGLQLEATVISRRKCYAPSVVGHTDAAFAIDVNFPNRMPKKGRYFDVTGGSQISDTNLGVAPTQKPPPPSKKSKRKSMGT